MKKTIKNYWITPEQVMEWNPCYPDWSKENVLTWFKGRKKVRLSTILKDEKISHRDRAD